MNDKLQPTKFGLPVNLQRLRNDRVRLVPMELCPDSDLEEFVVGNPELWKHLPIGPYASVAAYRQWHVEKIQGHMERMIFAIYLSEGVMSKRVPGSKRDEQIHVAEGTFAGTIGLTDAAPSEGRVEIGHVIILPRFQRTVVNSQSTGLLLKHLLDPITQGDLQLRRVQWQANSSNRPSIAAAQRLGFELEGIMRYARTINDDKECVSTLSHERSEGLPTVDVAGGRIGKGRHSAMLALCWDDWLQGKREHVMKLLEQA